MFATRSQPLRLDSARLHGLRMSLNAPVVSLSELPAGRARAAILVHREEEIWRVTVAVRSLEDGSVTFYEPEGRDAEFDTPHQGADSALSFSETMGFVFDEDEFEGADDDGRRRALARCRAFLEPAPAEVPSPDSDAAPEGGPDPEVLLETLADERAARAEDGAPQAPHPLEARRDAAPAPAEAPPVLLTKFREAPRSPRAGSDPSPDETPREQPRAAGAMRRAVGWVRLVRRARRRESPPSPLLELLARF